MCGWNEAVEKCTTWLMYMEHEAGKMYYWATALLLLSAAIITTAMSEDGKMTEPLPELLKAGLEVYRTLKDDMERALGLKRYADHLSDIVEKFKGVEQYLNNNEKAIQNKLKIAHSLTKEGLEKATVVVTVIKEQSNALVSVLDPSASGTKQEKMWAACQYFASFAKDIESKVNEAEGSLRRASGILHESQMELNSVVHTLQRLQEQFLHDKKRAISKKKESGLLKAVIGIAAAFVGGGPFAAVLGVVGALEDNMSIHDIEKEFKKQRETISMHIRGFGTMSAETKALQERLDGKRQKLIDIHAKLSATGTLAGTKLESLPLIHFDLVRKKAKDLVKACETFLVRH